MIILLYVVKTFLGPSTQQTRNATVSLPVSVSVFLSVCLSVRMEQLGSYRADFTEILYRDSLLNPVG
jgi:hypothetical protein